MQYVPPLGATDPNAPYIEGNPPAGIRGSYPTAAGFEGMMREIVNAIENAGLTPDANDLTQLGRALITSATEGLGKSEGAFSLNFPGLTEEDVLGTTDLLAFYQMVAEGGQAAAHHRKMPAGTFAAQIIALAQASILALITANAPQVATADVTLNVNPTGNDATADGSTGKPFATIAAAIAYGNARYVFGGFGLVIQLSQSTVGTPSTYHLPPGEISSAARVTIQGDPANQSAYIIAGAGPAAGGSGLVLSALGIVNLVGVTVINTSNINNVVGCTGGGILSATNVTVTTSGIASNGFSAFIAVAGTVKIQAGCVVNGGYWSDVFSASLSGGNLELLAMVAFTNPPTCSGQIALSFLCATIFIGTGVSITGTANGARFLVTEGGAVHTSGQGVNFFPGTSAGTVDTSTYGIYD